MSTYPVPTSLPVPPRAWHTGPDRERIAAEAARVSEGAGPFPGLAVEQDPAAARRLGRQVQAASRRAAGEGFAPIPPDTRDERVAGMLRAANYLAAVSAEGPDDEIGRWAFGLVHDIREAAARHVVVPAPSNIRPEMPRADAA